MLSPLRLAPLVSQDVWRVRRENYWLIAGDIKLVVILDISTLKSVCVSVYLLHLQEIVEG